MTQHAIPRPNRNTDIDLVLLRQDLPKIFQRYKNLHLKTLICRRSQTKTFLDRQVNGPGLDLSSSQEGMPFGKNHASDFVRNMPGKILLTKALNY